MSTAVLEQEQRTAVAALLRPRRAQAMEQWAEEQFFITRGPVIGRDRTPVRFSLEFDPLGRDILSAMQDERWTRIVEMASPQASGKTGRVLILMLWSIEQLRRDVFYFTPSLGLTRKQWRSKIKEGIDASPALRDLLSDQREERGDQEQRLFKTSAGTFTSLYLAGAESRGALAAVSAELVIGDDVQGMQPFPEGDHPCDVARERADALPGRRQRHVNLGQPGVVGDYLSNELFHVSTCYVPFVPCLECDTYQMIEWDRMVYDATDPDAALADTYLRCANETCDHQIRHDELRSMLERHRWISMPSDVNWITDPPAGGVTIDVERAAVYPKTDRRTTVCGFWRSALYWPFVPWGEQAVRAIEAKGSPQKQINFGKRIRAVPWQDPDDMDQGLDPEEIKAHVVEGHVFQTIPAKADLVTLTVDVQHGYVYWDARAWRKSDGTSWLVDIGTSKEKHKTSGLPGGLELAARMARDGWPYGPGSSRAGEVLRPTLCLIDSKYMPDLVWRHCVRYGLGLWRPVQGSPTARMIWPSKPNKKGTRRYWPIAVNEAKTVLYKLLQITAGNAGYWHMPDEIPTQTLTAYSRHMTSEVWDESRRLWVKRKEKKRPGEPAQWGGRNDWWDCETYQIAAALACGVRLPAFDPPPPPAPTPARRPPPTRRPARTERRAIRRRYQ